MKKSKKTYHHNPNRTNKTAGLKTRQPAAKPVVVQTKLKVGEPNDQYEKEADQVAERVVSQPVASTALQTKSVSSQSPGILNRMPEDEVQTKPLPSAPLIAKPVIQTKPINIQRKETGKKGANASNWVQSTIQSTRGQGQKMDGNTQGFMEQRFGADFSRVNIHTDNNAIQMSQQLGAKAFTTGNDVYFNQGQYQPSHQEGQKLIAHELTHTLQQTGTIQKQDEDDYDEVLEEEFSELDKEVDLALLKLIEDEQEAKKAKDFETYAFLRRVELLLSDREPYDSQADFKDFYEEAHEIATDEQETIDFMDVWVLEFAPDAFPETWADLVHDAMYLDGFDMGDLQSKAREASEALEKVAEKVPPYLFDHALPIRLAELKKLKKFQLQFHHAKMKQDHIVKDFMIAGFDSVGHGWLLNFVSTWNGMVEAATDSIRSGEMVIKATDYHEFVEMHGTTIGNLPDRFQRTWNAVMAEEAEDLQASLNETSLAIMVFSGFGSIANLFKQWQDAFSLFDKKKDATSLQLIGLEKQERVIKAITWAYELGYLGDAGDQIMKGIEEHGLELIGMAILIIGALVASHIYPPLGIGLDILLLIWSGVNIIGSIDNMMEAIKALYHVDSIEDMQKSTGNLAESLVGDGFILLIETASLVLSMGMITSHVRAIRAAERGITTEEALIKAMTKSKDSAMIKNASESQKFLDQVGNTQAARSAVAKAQGDVTKARKIFEASLLLEKESAVVLARINNIPEGTALELIKKANLTVDEIRILEQSARKIELNQPLSPDMASQSARIMTRVGVQKHLIFSGVNDVELIWGSQRYWGNTEGAVYGARMPVNTLLEHMKAMVLPKEGLVVFQGQAAKLFHAHEVEGGYSLMKNLLGQHKSGFGDIVFLQSQKHGKDIIVTEARISPRHHAPVPKRLEHKYTKDEWAYARVEGRRTYLEPVFSYGVPGIVLGGGYLGVVMLYDYVTEP